jgi:hypothetical protein
MMGCGEFADVAAELALGVLTGRERADAIAHMEHCEACREMVRQLAATGEDLVGLLPQVEPPAGFETRVLERIGIERSDPPRRERARSRRATPSRPSTLSRRVLAIAAVSLAVVAAGLGGWGLRGLTSPAAPVAQAPAASPLSSGTLLSADHQDVGKVFYYAGASRWMYMSVDLPAGLGTVRCQLRTADGHYITVGSFWLASGYGSWAGPDHGTHAPITGARLVDAKGTVLATARFS